MERSLTFFVYFESKFRDFIITPSEIYGEKVPFYSDIIADEIYHLLLWLFLAQFLGLLLRFLGLFFATLLLHFRNTPFPVGRGRLTRVNWCTCNPYGHDGGLRS